MHDYNDFSHFQQSEMPNTIRKACGWRREEKHIQMKCECHLIRMSCDESDFCTNEQSNKMKYLKKKKRVCCLLRAKHPTDYLFFVNLSTYLYLPLVSTELYIGATKLQMNYLETIKSSGGKFKTSTKQFTNLTHTHKHRHIQERIKHILLNVQQSYRNIFN